MNSTVGSLGDRVVQGALYVFCGMVFFYLVFPVLAIIPLSFNGGSFLSYPLAGVSLRWYREIATSPDWIDALWNSLIVASATALLATLLGTLAAVGLMRLGERTRSALTLLLLSPLFVPVIVTAVAVYLLYAALGLANTYTGLVLADTTLAAPFVIIVVRAALQGFDSNLLRAGASLGAPPRMVLARVLVPLVAPGVLAGAVFAFMTSFDETVVAIFLAGPTRRTLPLQMFEGVRDEISPAITAVTTVLIVTSACLFLLVELLRRHSWQTRVSV
jgi:putative spermidine/putrescine transport system permease protein